jgi:glutathione S-transferase
MIVVASRFRTYRVEIPEEFPKAKAWMDRVWKDETVKKMVNKAVEDELVLEKYDVG